MIEKGRYPGRIERAWCEDKDGYPVMCFEVPVATDEGTQQTWPRQYTSGQSLKHAKRLAEYLELGQWPECLFHIEKCEGRDVEVSVKHTVKDGQTYVNAYIVTGPGGEPATPDQLKAGIAKLAAQESADEPLPF